MKKISVMLLGLALVVSLSACGKQPTEEMGATRASIDAAVSEGAENVITSYSIHYTKLYELEGKRHRSRQDWQR